MNELQQLLQQLMQAIQAVMQSGEELTDEFQGQLAQTLELLVNRIEELEQEEPVEGMSPPLPPTPEVNPAGYPSSNINGFKYDPKTQQLLVKFQDKYPGQNGPIYSYGGVPKYIYDVFSRGAVAPRTSGRNAWHAWKEGVTPSLGASMYALIRNNFPYQRVS